MSSPLESLQTIKKDRNLRSFFLAYFLSYGTFVAFASNCNFIIKPYGYSDMEIAANAVCLMLAGACGAITFNLFIKRTFNFSLALRIISVGSTLFLSVLCLWLNTTNAKPITTLIISLLFLFPTTRLRTCIFNGRSHGHWSSQRRSSLMGIHNQHNSRISSWFQQLAIKLMTMIVLSLFILAGSLLFYRINIHLKRHSY